MAEDKGKGLKVYIPPKEEYPIAIKVLDNYIENYSKNKKI